MESDEVDIEEYEEYEEEDEVDEVPDGDWDWDAEDDDMEQTWSLLSAPPKLYPSVKEALQADREIGLNLPKIVRQLKLDFYDTIKLINYLRTQIAEYKSPLDDHQCTSREDLLDYLQKNSQLEKLQDLSQFNKDTHSFWSAEDYLRPFDPEDALLMVVDEIPTYFLEENEENPCKSTETTETEVISRMKRDDGTFSIIDSQGHLTLNEDELELCKEMMKFKQDLEERGIDLDQLREIDEEEAELFKH